MKVIKQKIGIEDLHSNTTNRKIKQTRNNTDVIITSVDAESIPYYGIPGEIGAISIKDKIDELEVKVNKIDELSAKVDKIDELSNKVDNLGKELKDFKKEVYQLFEKNTREIATVINQLSESISTKNHRNSEETKQRLEKNDKEHRIYEAQIAKLQLTTQYLEEKGKKLA